MKKIIVLILCILMIPSFTAAVEIGGVKLPESLMAGKEKLVLNGAGLRKKMFFKIYAGGLYLKEKEKDSKKIINADEPMAIRMRFIYDGIPGKDMVKTWNEGFNNGNTALIQEDINKFNSFFKEDVRAGDIYDIIYTPGLGIRVYIKDKLMGTVEGHEFKKALFAIWLGDKPADSSLKDDMLGK